MTVTGESPIVDVQSARRQTQMSTELIEALPTAQGYAAIATLMPSFVVSGGGNNNVQLNTGMIVFGGRGGRGNEGIAQTDGIGTGAAIFVSLVVKGASCYESAARSARLHL